MKLVVLVGPTAAGKTSLAIKLAKALNGEILCADSRTVYKYLDIGTAKPTAIEQSQAKHHLINIVEPNDNFNVSDFKTMADKSIKEISQQSKIPILVGGSGLYINSVVYNYQFADSSAPRNINNLRHLAPSANSTKSNISKGTIFVGIKMDRAELMNRITKRVDLMISQGLIDEVRLAYKKYPNCKALLAPAYKAYYGYLTGTKTLDKAREDTIIKDLQLAKRQLTWFKRDPNIIWFNNTSMAYDYILSKITD